VIESPAWAITLCRDYQTVKTEQHNIFLRWGNITILIVQTDNDWDILLYRHSGSENKSGNKSREAHLEQGAKITAEVECL
jgi:hypothetical protein